MNTLTPKIIEKFKPVFRVEEYRELLAKYQSRVMTWMTHKEGAKEEYWNRLPEYVLSKCPLCGAEHTDCLDLHSFVMRWGGGADTFNEGHVHRSSVYQSCEHHVAMPTFIHLNGYIPDEPINLGSEVPFLSTFLFPSEIKESYAVINAFPLCRVEGDRFVPRYTLFVLKYYGADPRALKRLRDIPNWGGEARPPFLYQLEDAWEHRADKVFDLQYWVEQGRLYWLEEEKGKAVLKNDPASFPYAGIEGYVEGRVYENHQLRARTHDNPPRYYPTWKPEGWPKEEIARLRAPRDEAPLPWARYCLLVVAALPVLAIVTSLFFRPILSPFVAWMLMLIGLGTAGYITIRSNYSLHKAGRTTRPAFARSIAIDLTGLLLTTGTAILAGGLAVRIVGVWILKVTGLAWLGVICGMLAAFAAGFGSGWLVRWAWKRIFKAQRRSRPIS